MMANNSNSNSRQSTSKDDEDTTTPPPLHQVYLNGDQVYTCSGCHTHLAKNDDIISKGFQGRHGRAYLFKAVHNISLGPKEDRVLMTGLHSVADISCIVCQSVVGWIYIYAFEDSQKYKEGKYIVEKAKISKENFWVQRT